MEACKRSAIPYRARYVEPTIFGKFAMILKLSAAAALFSLLMPFAAHADLPGDRPAYRHALSNLHAARRSLQHRPGEIHVGINEDIAITDIDRAIGEVKKSAREDATNMDDSVGDDANLDRPGRLHHAVELLEKAHDDLNREESDPRAQALRRRALDHIDHAIDATRHAIRDIEHSR